MQDVAAVRTDLVDIYLLVWFRKGQNCEGDRATIAQADYHVDLLIAHPVNSLQPSTLWTGRLLCPRVRRHPGKCTEMNGNDKFAKLNLFNASVRLAPGYHPSTVPHVSKSFGHPRLRRLHPQDLMA